jgi:hypothetical protein
MIAWITKPRHSVWSTLAILEHELTKYQQEVMALSDYQPLALYVSTWTQVHLHCRCIPSSNVHHNHCLERLQIDPKWENLTVYKKGKSPPRLILEMGRAHWQGWTLELWLWVSSLQGFRLILEMGRGHWQGWTLELWLWVSSLQGFRLILEMGRAHKGELSNPCHKEFGLCTCVRTTQYEVFYNIQHNTCIRTCTLGTQTHIQSMVCMFKCLTYVCHIAHAYTWKLSMKWKRMCESMFLLVWHTYIHVALLEQN